MFYLLAEYFYLDLGIFLLIFWVVFFCVLKTRAARRRMIVSSLYSMLLTPLVEFLCLTDWWNPLYVGHGFVHLEDFMFGFGIAGIVSAAYQIIRKEPIVPSTNARFKFGLFASTIVLIAGLYFEAEMNSFWSLTIPFALLTIVLALKNRHSLVPMILTGGFIVILILPMYLFALMIHPYLITDEWLLTGFPAIRVLGIPIGELIWYFFAGTAMGGFQELMR